MSPYAANKAHEFWNWFRTAPHNESRDADCEAKLADLIREAQESALGVVLFHHDIPDSSEDAIRETLELKPRK